MRFVFFEKDLVETNIIIDILSSENISFQTKAIEIEHVFFDDIEEKELIITENLYDIYINTDLEHYDFVKKIADKKIEDRLNLERCYMLKARDKKNVQRVHKKNITDTNTKYRSKQ